MRYFNPLIQRLWLVFILILLNQTIYAGVKLPCFISKGMVLQRDKPIPVWGWADAGEELTLSFKNKEYKIKAGADRKWKALLNPQKAGGPYKMTIRSRDTAIVIDDILMGDVWLCSGQSNMAANMGRGNIRDFYKEEISKVNYPQIRQFLVDIKMGFRDMDDVSTKNGWVSANNKTISTFSAVAYFFAKDLHERYKVPIGLITSSVGGTPAESWVSSEDLKEFPEAYANANRYKDDAVIEKIMANHKLAVEKWKDDVANNDKGLNEKWFDSDYIPSSEWASVDKPVRWVEQFKEPVYGTVWYRTEILVPEKLAGKQARLALGIMQTTDETYINGHKIGSTTSNYSVRNYAVPSGILKVGKNTITIRLISQNGGAGFEPYDTLKLVFDNLTVSLSNKWLYRPGIKKKVLPAGNGMPLQSPTAYYYAMIKPLSGLNIKGIIWYQGEANTNAPEKYHQLFSILIKAWRRDFNQSDLPFLFVQLANFSRSGKEPEISNWALLREAQTQALQLHNTGMAVTHDIGERRDIHPRNKGDVGRRLALAAHKIAYRENIEHSGPIYQSMEVRGDRVYITFTHAEIGLSVKGDTLQHFVISGDGKTFTKASAKIEGNKVVVWNEKITEPTAVRYAWADSPDGANLYNKEGLPASSFRTDK